MGVGKVFECQGGSELKERWIKNVTILISVVPTDEVLYKLDDIVFADALAVHSDALTEINEVGRGVKSYTQASFLQDACQRMGNGTLTVGACHMDGLVVLMGVSVVGIEGLGGLQARLIGCRPDVFEHRCGVVEILYDFLIVHGRWACKRKIVDDLSPATIV